MGGCPARTLPGLRRCRNPRQTGQPHSVQTRAARRAARRWRAGPGLARDAPVAIAAIPVDMHRTRVSETRLHRGDGVSAQHLGAKPIIVQICTISAGWTPFTPAPCRPRGLLPGQGKPWQPMFGAAGRPLVPGYPCRLKPSRPPCGPPARRWEAGPPDAQGSRDRETAPVSGRTRAFNLR